MTGPAGRPAVSVSVPATSANLGPGFDALGLALALRDEVTVRVVTGPGVRVEVTGEGAADVPRDASHLVVRAMTAAFERLGEQPPGVSLHCVNRIPHGRGLGSSAAAVVAGVLAARALADRGAARMDDAAVLRLADELEGHPDNAAACLLGGLTIAWRDDSGVHATRLDPSPEVAATVFVPEAALSTETARGMLPAVVPHADAAHAAGRAALLVDALTRRPDLLLAATEDRLHQTYRAAAMPATLDLVRRLRERGVAAVVSGAGPSVLALTPVDAATDLAAVAAAAGGGWRVVPLPLDGRGAAAARLDG
ncbi:MAG TPA: homoserine kinase [Actinomycetes bacterium]